MPLLRIARNSLALIQSQAFNIKLFVVFAPRCINFPANCNALTFFNTFVNVRIKRTVTYPNNSAINILDCHNTELTHTVIIAACDIYDMASIAVVSDVTHYIRIKLYVPPIVFICE